MAMIEQPERGHLYWVRIPGERGGKQRPALVVSIDSRNRNAGDVMVVPASTTLRPSMTHVHLRRGQGGVPRECVLKCEQLTTLPKEHVLAGPLSGPLSALMMSAVEKGVFRAIGVPVPNC
jgi:mRNA-degrading endonuclease toxin of MazEF toxin-antitoxin module